MFVYVHSVCVLNCDSKISLACELSPRVHGGLARPVSHEGRYDNTGTWRTIYIWTCKGGSEGRNIYNLGVHRGGKLNGRGAGALTENGNILLQKLIYTPYLLIENIDYTCCHGFKLLTHIFSFTAVWGRTTIT